MLTLPIKKKWFDMIKSGEKKEEYREIKPYWTKRLGFEDEIDEDGEIEHTYQVNTYVILRNGYASNSPSIKCYVRIEKGYGKEEWGAELGKMYYVLKILSVEKCGDDNGQ